MNKSLMAVPVILVIVACKPLSESPLCDETQRAINDANFFILTHLVPFKGDVQTVRIIESPDNISTVINFAQCGRLETFERESKSSTSTEAKTLRDKARWQKGKGWVTEWITLTRSASGKMSKLIMTKRYDTDKSGRIISSSGVITGIDAPRAMSSIVYSYNDQHQLVNRMIRGGMIASLSFNYDYKGRYLSRISSSDSTSTLRWDEQGRWLSRETQTDYSGKRESRCLAWDQVGNCVDEFSERQSKTERVRYKFTYYQ
ncbi:hypothetical protein ACV822_001407 [Klebsiella aerogenes]|uniref:hypothetical protein n=1 Tax=Klebsiella aerogenes TaxID=548 RepID=UPI00277CB9A7|nr:hypothetical protein [Klebsiella aerogenes]HCR0140873.1 hypothetical protein [Klebsiella aerogenes]HDS6593364.1 hypothetical protein [Klebsiella aerogenes]HDU6300763.1 hypothetical protein [Klebsiella aerogenes]